MRANLLGLCASVIFILQGISSANGQNFNRPVPPGVFPYEFRKYTQSPINGYYLLSPFKLKTQGNFEPLGLGPIILDEHGYLAWYMPTNAQFIFDIEYFPAFKRFGYIKFDGKDIWYKFLDSTFGEADSFTNSPGIGYDSHELQILKNGNYVIGGLKDSIFDLSPYTFKGIPGSDKTNAVGFVIEEFDPEGKLVFQWNSNDYIHPSLAYEQFGYSADNFDYAHGNAIAEALDGNFLVSLRHLNAIYKIDRMTGNVIWKLGGKQSDFTFTNDPGFSGQHDIREKANGHFTLYDNANTTPGNPTRAVEYVLDLANHTATRVWDYKYSPAFFARAMGSHQLCENGSRLINYGLTFRPNPTCTHIDQNDNLIADIFLRDSVISYRSHFFDFPLHSERPAIACSRQNGKLVLSAPGGFDRYIWQTGETTQTITANAPGTYQVWVNYGTGMLGSDPYFVTEISTDCTVGIEELKAPGDDAKIIAVYDLLGRRITTPKAGKLYIVQRQAGKPKLEYLSITSLNFK
jgi:hypothetical protein